MHNPYIAGLGALVVIVAISVISYAAIRLAQSAPRALVRALLALAIVLGALPAVLYALYGA